MNNNRKFLVFSHEQDVDGLFSAAVLKMAHPQSEVILTNHGFENMLAVKEKILSFIRSYDSGTIILSDIAVNHGSYLPMAEALNISNQKGFSNIWIDHHVWAEEMRKYFLQSGKWCSTLKAKKGVMNLKNVQLNFVSNALLLLAHMQRLLDLLHIGLTFQTLLAFRCLL